MLTAQYKTVWVIAANFTIVPQVDVYITQSFKLRLSALFKLSKAQGLKSVVNLGCVQLQFPS